MFLINKSVKRHCWVICRAPARLIGVDYVCEPYEYAILYFPPLSCQTFTQEELYATHHPPNPYVLLQFIFCHKVSSAHWCNRKHKQRKHRALIKRCSDFPEGRLSSSINLVYHIIKRLPCPSLSRQLVLIRQQVFHGR